MKPLLTRRYLAENVEQAIRDAIGEGKFRDYLPGERRLSELLGVSRPTLRLALGNLARLGVIKVVKGKRTRVNPDQAPVTTRPVEASTRIVLLAPYGLDDFSSGSLIQLDMVRAKLDEAGMFMEFRVCTWLAKPGQEVNLRNFTRHEKPAAWILYNAHPDCQRWFSAQGLPAMAYGLPDPESDLPGIDACIPESVTHAFTRLRKAGHDTEKIAIINPDLDLFSVRLCDQSFIACGGLAENIVKHPALPPGMRTWVEPASERLFARGVTAVIVNWPDAAMLLLTYNGIVKSRTLPRDLSLVCLHEDYSFGVTLPEVARYERSADRYATAVVRLALQVAKGVSGKRKCLRVFPNLVNGQTIGAPRP